MEGYTALTGYRPTFSEEREHHKLPYLWLETAHSADDATHRQYVFCAHFALEGKPQTVPRAE